MALLKVDNVSFEEELVPSNIKEGMDILKNTERALDGTLYVDFNNKKKTLEISWGFLTEDKLQIVLNAFAVDRVLQVTYYNNTDKTNQGNAKDFYVDKINYTPKYLGEQLVYNDIVVSLLEV